MHNADMTEAELSRKTNVPQPTIHRLLSGATPDPRISTLRPLAKFFNITINQLLGDEPIDSSRTTGKFTRLNRVTQIPIISWQDACKWSETLQNLTLDAWEDWTIVDINASVNAYALIIDNHLLGNKFPYGALLVVEPDCKPEEGDYIIVHAKSSKKAMLRQLLIEGDEKWLLPLNEKMNTIPFNKECTFCGSIIQSKVTFNRRGA